ncbi:hypothetical protein ACIRG8_04025 [Streptomyces sp. NPDC102359]|uniref:hypothetical protein n=1 Tax=unclassified Streptomyces TaxID=2593676 RepID=UPI0038068E82
MTGARRGTDDAAAGRGGVGVGAGVGAGVGVVARWSGVAWGVVAARRAEVVVPGRAGAGACGAGGRGCWGVEPGSGGADFAGGTDTGVAGALARAGLGAGVGAGDVPRCKGAPRPGRTAGVMPVRGAAGVGLCRGSAGVGAGVGVGVRGCTGVLVASVRGAGAAERWTTGAVGADGAGAEGRPAASRWMGGPTGVGAGEGVTGDGAAAPGRGTATEVEPSGGSTVRPVAGFGASPDGVRGC